MQETSIRGKTKKSADNDITLWLAVLDFTISTFEDQLDFAKGRGKPTPPSNETMNIKLIKEFLGYKPRRMNAHKQAFLDIWLCHNLVLQH